MARLNERQGRPAAALAYVRRAIALLDVTDDTLQLARAHLLCGRILMSEGRTEDAGRHFDLAEQLFGPPARLAQQGQRRDYADVYRAWGEYLRSTGREEEALEVLERADDLASEPVGADAGATR